MRMRDATTPLSTETSTHRGAKRRRRCWIGLAIGMVGLLATSWLARQLVLQGLLFPVRIGSGSMAPALLGPHYEVTCDDCEFRWPVDAFADIPFERLVCPNCGKRSAYAPESLPRNWGDRILIDRWSYLHRAPRRWELAVYRSPSNPKQLEVKRVAGLPGEHISIRYGDLYANGQLLRKRLDELRRVAILVHDDRYSPRQSMLPDRWAAEPPSEDGIAWTSFRAWRCFDSPLPRSDETLVFDNDSYNPSLRRQTHAVYDLLLSFHVEARAPATLSLRGHNGWAEYRLDVPFSGGQGTLERDGQLVAEAELPAASAALNGVWEFALVDEQVILAIGGREVLVYREPSERDGPRRAVHRPLAYATSGDAIAIRERRVWRDLHYLSPERLRDQWSGYALGDDHYLLLGDNVPLSIDSRHATTGIPRNHMLGRALPYFR